MALAPFTVGLPDVAELRELHAEVTREAELLHQAIRRTAAELELA